MILLILRNLAPCTWLPRPDCRQLQRVCLVDLKGGSALVTLASVPSQYITVSERSVLRTQATLAGHALTYICIPRPDVLTSWSHIWSLRWRSGTYLLKGEGEGKTWKYFSPLWLGTQYFSTLSPPSLSSLSPSQGPKNCWSLFVQGSLNSEKTPEPRIWAANWPSTSVLIQCDEGKWKGESHHFLDCRLLLILPQRLIKGSALPFGACCFNPLLQQLTV